MIFNKEELFLVVAIYVLVVGAGLLLTLFLG
jgi:hypothetical protein